MRLASFALFALLVCAPVYAQAAEASLVVEGDTLMLLKDGKKQSLPNSMGTMEAVANSKLRFTTLSSYDEELPKIGVRAGLYLIDPDGKITYVNTSIPDPFADDNSMFTPEMLGDGTFDLTLSPRGDLLALSQSTSPIGQWVFLSYPSLAYKNSTSYLMNYGDTVLFWPQDNTVILQEIQTETDRVCEYDPCGPVSVVAYNIETGKATPLKAGTSLCDYRLQSIENNTAKILELCTKSPADWKTFPDEATDKVIEVPLP